MSGSVFGNMFKVSTFGESHGKALGVIVDGCPSGVSLCEEDIQKYLNRRKPGQSNVSTPRKEADEVEILSGVFEGKTTGTPIAMMVRNTSQKSADYSEIASYYRPGHADFTFDAKYGFRDYRGGGRSSGRETLARVAAGAVALKVLKELGIEIFAYTYEIGGITIDEEKFDKDFIMNNELYIPDKDALEKIRNLVIEKKAEGDSIGGVIKCKVKNLMPGIGEPVFDKLDANIAKAIMSIGAVKAFEIGNGVNASKIFGSENNDNFIYTENGIEKMTNNSGGVLGGISDGDEVYFKAYFKPTPSIFKEQKTVNKDGENISINIKGRHDPIIVPRAVVVVEAMTALAILDLVMLNTCSNIDNLKKVYK
ncbi:chorismate synthase [Lachnospiraceae bacterium RM5]|nr:chorismate synthase [Lachnospiraceae bacterium RM5]